jgi:protease-4
MAKKEASTAKTVVIIILSVLGVFIILPILLILLIGIVIGISSGGSTSTYVDGNVAFLTVDGIILTQGSNSIFDDTAITSSKRLTKTLENIKNDDSIKGVIFEINSPGGSGVASDEIATAINNLDKPTVSYIREVGASGAYWVASSTDYIYANKFSTVGSIGVIASYLDFSGLLADYNVSYQRFVAGDHKDFGSPFRTPTAVEEAKYQKILDTLHTIFIEEVAKGRDMSIDDVTALADGSIYTGYESVDLGLIDAYGGENEAIAYMEAQINETAELVTYGAQPTFLDSLLGVVSKQSFAIGKGIGSMLTANSNTPVFRT